MSFVACDTISARMIFSQRKNTISIDEMHFPGGEIQVRVARPVVHGEAVEIMARLHSSHDIMKLLLVTDAVRRQVEHGMPVHLVCPYLPYARQDRVCSTGEAHSLKVMCNLINSQGYASVTVWDPHSDVAPALLERCSVISAADIICAEMCQIFKDRISGTNGTVLVSPDAGAAKKVMEVGKRLTMPVLQATKVRDPMSGAISNTAIIGVGERLSGMEGCDFLIVDDICDGGRTFIELAKVLRPLTTGKIKLYVTHGIFSQGVSIMLKSIDEIYTANIHSSVSDAAFIGVVGFNKIEVGAC